MRRRCTRLHSASSEIDLLLRCIADCSFPLLLFLILSSFLFLLLLLHTVLCLVHLLIFLLPLHLHHQLLPSYTTLIQRTNSHLIHLPTTIITQHCSQQSSQSSNTH